MRRTGPQPYIGINAKRNARSEKMTTTRILQSLLIAALLSSGAAHAAESNIVIALESGKQVARFQLADSRCVLKDDQIRCTPVNK